MKDDRRFESVYSIKVRAGKRRTYFFDVRRTKGDDFYLTLTESTKKFNGHGYERHKIFLYKEDFNRFLSGLEETINHIKTELMPDYDYEEFDRRQEEWETRRAEEDAAEASDSSTDDSEEDDADAEDNEDAADDEDAEDDADDDATEEASENEDSHSSPAGDSPDSTEEDMSW